jgi:hypothetical protein
MASSSTPLPNTAVYLSVVQNLVRWNSSVPAALLAVTTHFMFTVFINTNDTAIWKLMLCSAEPHLFNTESVSSQGRPKQNLFGLCVPYCTSDTPVQFITIHNNIWHRKECLGKDIDTLNEWEVWHLNGYSNWATSWTQIRFNFLHRHKIKLQVLWDVMLCCWATGCHFKQLLCLSSTGCHFKQLLCLNSRSISLLGLLDPADDPFTQHCHIP